MRVWPFTRRSGAASAAHEDVVLAEELLRRRVDDLFVVRERRVLGGVVVFRGDLLVEPGDALEVLRDRFDPLGYTPFLRREGDGIAIQAWPLVQTIERPRVAVNVVLFVLTCLSTLLAGALMSGGLGPLSLGWLLSGAPFAATLLGILGTHEFGHYFTARYYKASVTLPYFIPAPPPFLFGTLGAIIRMRSPARDRNALFDIAAAGPLAGLVVAIPAIIAGLAWSRMAPVPPGEHLAFGDSILMRWLVQLQFGAIPPGWDVFIHPVALAGWVGLFVTALNLFPVGQLDGGRIAYAMFGARHRLVGRLTFGALLLLALITWSPNWLVWAALIFFLVGFQHHPPLDDITPLSPARRLVGAACLVLLVLLIPPTPISIG
jgi:membrane-associated protease RseP (regulator of RpoE activity)